MTDEQKFVLDKEKATPNTTMCNVYPLLVKLKDFVDTEKLAGVLSEALKIHTALSYIIEGERQHYVPNLYNITVEHMSENDFMTLKDNLIQPFDLGGCIVQI